MTKTNEEIARQLGLTVDQVAAIRAAADGGTVKPRLLHDDDAIAQRRAELAAERASNPITNKKIHAMLADLHANH